jgi:hypothetical protein
MANGETIATKEDGAIQRIRWERAEQREEWITEKVRSRAKRQCVGWSIGRGYESDYLEAHALSELVRYNDWLKRKVGFNGEKSIL